MGKLKVRPVETKVDTKMVQLAVVVGQVEFNMLRLAGLANTQGYNDDCYFSPQ